jgi:hypothetical protein
MRFEIIFQYPITVNQNRPICLLKRKQEVRMMSRRFLLVSVSDMSQSQVLVSALARLLVL